MTKHCCRDKQSKGKHFERKNDARPSPLRELSTFTAGRAKRALKMILVV